MKMLSTWFGIKPKLIQFGQSQFGYAVIMIVAFVFTIATVLSMCGTLTTGPWGPWCLLLIPFFFAVAFGAAHITDKIEELPKSKKRY